MHVQVIVFRACTPLAQAFLDYLFLGRSMPNARSIVALVGIALGAVAYVRADSEFQIRYRAFGVLFRSSRLHTIFSAATL